VKFNYINGDIMTNALFAVAHRVAMECDIIYSTRNGPLFPFFSPSLWIRKRAGSGQIRNFYQDPDPEKSFWIRTSPDPI
jgi:hypothetical protein